MVGKEEGEMETHMVMELFKDLYSGRGNHKNW